MLGKNGALKILKATGTTNKSICQLMVCVLYCTGISISGLKSTASPLGNDVQRLSPLLDMHTAI